MRRHDRSTFLLSSLVLLTSPLAHAQTTSAPSAPAESTELARAALELLTRNYATDAPGAAVLIALGDSVVFRAARGEADIEKHSPLQPDSVFRIGSVSKQFAAAGLLTLVEAGKVKLDDPLSKYVADYPGGERITVLELLNHTSGVKSYTALPGYMDEKVQRDLTTTQMIDVFEHEPPDFAPGSRWAYNNSGYVLVGAVIEAASGEPWHVYLKEALFEPLGMEHTGYALDAKLAAAQVHGYSFEGERVVPSHALSMTQPHAAGALLSNVDDLWKWNRALHEGRVLSSATYSKMITPVGPAVSAHYGFGLFTDAVREHDVLRHGGAIFGFHAALTYVPGPDVTVVVLENDDATNAGDSAETLVRKLAAIALSDPYPAQRAVAVDPKALRSAEGVYRFDAATTRVLRVVDGQLTAQRDRGPRILLTPIAADDFLYEDGFNRAKLERDAAGKITALRFFANGDGRGEVGVLTNDPLPAAPIGVQLTRAQLERVTGTYKSGGFTLKVFLDGDAPKAQLAGQEPVTLRATSATEFDVEETGAALEFTGGDAPASKVTMRQNGREMVLERAP